MATIKKEKQEEIIRQCIEEYDHALEYREKRETDWLSIDELYYGKKKKSLVTRANIHVPKMQGTIETFLSKIDDSPFIRYEAMEEADLSGTTIFDYENGNNLLRQIDKVVTTIVTEHNMC